MSAAAKKVYELTFISSGIVGADLGDGHCVVGFKIPADKIEFAIQTFPTLVFLAGMGAAINETQELLK